MGPQPTQQLRRRRATVGNRNENVRAEPAEPERLPRRQNAPRNNIQARAGAVNNAPNRRSLLGAIQIKFLIKIVLLVYIIFLLDTTFSIKPHFNRKTKKLICILASVYYFQNVGFLEYLKALMCGAGNRRRQQNVGEGNQGENQGDGAGQDPVPLPPRGNIPPATSPGLFIDLRCIIVSFLFSLHPSWYPVSMPSPNVNPGGAERNDSAEAAVGRDEPAAEAAVGQDEPAAEGQMQPGIET